MDMTVLTGYLAGILTTIAFVPQVTRAWKLKETRDISLSMLVLFGVGVLLWTAYGFWLSSLPIITANVATFLLILVLLALKLTYH